MVHFLSKILFAPLIVLLIYGIFFQYVLIGVVDKSFFYIDEVLLVLALFLILLPLQKDTGYTKMVVGLFVLVAVFFLLSFNSYSYRSEVTIFTQILMHFKAFFLFLLLYNFREYINFKWIVHSFLFLTIIGVVINMVMGESFIKMIDALVQYRFGFLRPVGLQGSTGNLGITFAYLYLFYMFHSSKESYSKILILTLVFASLFLLSSLRTPFIALLISFGFIFGASFKKLLFGGVLIALLVPIFMNDYMTEMVMLTIDDLASLSDPTEAQYIRGIMLYFSFVLAAKYFPFGTGAASYGTFLSDNSPVYQEIGVSTLWFFQQKLGIYDSNFASILGEFGVTGLLLFSFFLYKIIRLVVKDGANPAFAITFGGLLAFYSLVNPIFMSSFPALLMAVMLAAVVPTQKEKEQNKEQEEADEESEKQAAIDTELAPVSESKEPLS